MQLILPKQIEYELVTLIVQFYWDFAGRQRNQLLKNPPSKFICAILLLLLFCCWYLFRPHFLLSDKIDVHMGVCEGGRLDS